MTEEKFSDPCRYSCSKEKPVPNTKRGNPIDPLAFSDEPETHLGKAKGWLKDNDSFFDVIDQIIKDRSNHVLRVLKGNFTE